MNKGNQIAERHPIEPEELMAYLDGELALERAAETAAHLEHCRECQGIAADLQGVARRLMVWQVESGNDAGIPQRIVAALEERGEKKTAESGSEGWRALVRKRWKPLWVGALALAAVALVMVFSVGRPSQPMYEMAPGSTAKSHSAQIERGKPVETEAKDKIEFYSRRGSAGKLIYEPKTGLTTSENNAGPVQGGLAAPPPPPPGKSTVFGPMIVRTAGLTLVTKEFEKTRAELERTLKLHGGYVGQLGVSAPANSGRTLNATLRIPSGQLDSTLAELKKLGRVENESQSGEEVTQRYVDLQARLANARNTEQQLTDILRNRTGKLSDVLEVEQELDRVRGEIEEMEAERKNLAHQVDFATLTLTLTEQYEQQLQAVPVSTSTRLWNAAVEGYASMVEGLVSVMLFLFSVGPSLLLWGAVLFFPIRVIWRKLRTRAA